MKSPHHTPLEGRSLNVLGYDLLESFDPKLVEYEFDTPRFDSTHFKGFRRTSKEKKLPARQEIRYQPVHDVLFQNTPVLPNTLDQYIVPDRKATAQERRTFVDQSNNLGVNYWQALHYSDAQDVLEKIITEQLSTQISDFLNMDYIRSLSVGDRRTRTRIRDVYSALSLVSWQIA